MSVTQYVGYATGGLVATISALWLWRKQSAIYDLETRVEIEASADRVYEAQRPSLLRPAPTPEFNSSPALHDSRPEGASIFIGGPMLVQG